MDIVNVFKNEKVKHQVMMIEGDKCSVSPVYSAANGTIETDWTVLQEKDAKILYQSDTGGLLYVYNLDLPAKVEAENLKKLRRSNALSNMFEFERKSSVDLLKFVPWIITILAILKG